VAEQEKTHGRRIMQQWNRQRMAMPEAQKQAQMSPL
jgi:hypothetical protein